MRFSHYKAVLEGYQEHLFDLKCIAVYQGYWTGYYSNSKHPKPLSVIFSSLMREHKKAKKDRSNTTRKPSVGIDVDVESFLEKERKLKSINK